MVEKTGSSIDFWRCNKKMGISSHHDRYGVDRPTDDEKNDGATKDHLGDCKENVRTTTDSEEHDKTIEYPEMATSSDEDASDSEEEAGMSSDSEDDSSYNPPKIANTAFILEDSSHRDGSIYKGNSEWKRTYRIADLEESK
ncbi:Os12g0608200 [Oryza sativa Japonica Group]|uniref:Os12g0608200 protein n=1 Tax=Oryza sativa subsp. japonica TaxID=39947 RepID=A0A0P0YCM9_ORYSJ|nr:Os12g0608200 [Oryza sativa Japonica Group]